MKILNLTQHAATSEQMLAGVTDLPEAEHEELTKLLTFDTLPDRGEVERRAISIARMAANHGAECAMIGGAPFLMAPLEQSLKKKGITPLYAFSRRETREETLPDGSVKKISVFRHAGFVLAC